MKRLIFVLLVVMLSMGFNKNVDTRKEQRGVPGHILEKNKPKEPKFVFDVIPLNSPVKDGTAKFLLKTPSDYQILELKYVLINAFKIVSKEKNYSSANLIDGSQGKEFHLPVSSLPNGFYRLYVKITVKDRKDKKGTHLGYLYRSRFHDFVKFVINRPKSVPMPDPVKNDATVAGIDSDNDGIRDDVQIWINQTYSSNQEQKKAMEQMARSYQVALINAYIKEDAIRSSKIFMDSLGCMSSIFGVRNDKKPSDDLRAKMLNTKDRLYAEIEFEHNSSGQKYTLANNAQQERALCNF